MSAVSVKAECPACGGTGLYAGFAEPKGTAVVCLGCDGTGAEVISYRPFDRIKRRPGITTVRLSRGSLLAVGVGPTGGAISADEFYAGKRP